MKRKTLVLSFLVVGVVLFLWPVAGAAGTDEPGDTSAAIERTPAYADSDTESDGVWIDAYAQLPAGVVDTSAPSVALSEPTFSNLYVDEGFESGMGVWVPESGVEGGPTWGRTAYRHADGSFSAYCVGSAYDAPGPYPIDVDAWMIAGPFDLSQARAAFLEFDCYLNTEEHYDFLYAYHSGNGTGFEGWRWDGYHDWGHVGMDLSSRCGDPSVWVAFRFTSDWMVGDEGAYVDNAAVYSIDRWQEDTSELGYMRSWSTLTNANASGGSSFECSSGGSNVSVKFYGDYLGWIARTSAGQGRARVTLDYGTPETVDLYSATPAWQQTVWETPPGLSWGMHKVFIEYTGTRNPSAIGWGINVDAFDVIGTLSEAPLRYQHNRGGVRYSGPSSGWVTNWNDYASYLSFKRTNEASDAFMVKFTGNHIAWIGLKAPAYGKAAIGLDGVYQGTYSLYAPTQQWEQKIWAGSTTYGQHTLIVICTGTKEAASSGYYIDADAFDIQGVIGWE